MPAPMITVMVSPSSVHKARQECVVSIGIYVECDSSLLAHDDTFYGDDEYDAGAAEAEWSDSETDEESLSTSVLGHGSDLTLAILRPHKVETK